MTQPVQPGGPVVQTAGDAAKIDSYFVRDPITGGVREVDLENAQALLHNNGWLPADEKTGSLLAETHAKQGAAAATPALGKLGYGIARGVMTPLVDLALPQGSRVHEVLSEDSPWLVGGGEAAGMIGSALLGLGPAAALEQGGARVAAGLGAGNGLVRTAFGRGVQGGLESAAYGVMGAISEAHSQNVPLTAQRLGSEVIPGILFGVVLGGGLGGLEGLGAFGRKGTLPERLAVANKEKTDEIFKPGVTPKDGHAIAKREFGVDDPGSLTMLQAHANGVDPYWLKMAKDSGPVGERLRSDAYQSADRLAAAEREVVDRANDYLLGREEALRQVMSDVKRGHIERMIGEGEADPGAIGKLVRDHVGDASDEVLIAGSSNGLDDGIENFSYARDGMREESLALARKNFGADRPLEIGLYPGERPVLQDGRHRLAVAKENGVQKMNARIREYDAEGGLVREYERELPIAANRGQQASKWPSGSPANDLDAPVAKRGVANDNAGPGVRGANDNAIRDGFAVNDNLVANDNAAIRAANDNASDYPFIGNRGEVVANDNVIAASAKEKAREQFVDKVLKQIDLSSEAVLARSLGASPENLRERIIQGLAKGQNETIDALQAAMGSMKLSDEALQGFGVQGAWNQSPLGFVEKWRGQLEQLSSLPKGVNDSVGDIKKLLGNLDMVEQSLARDPRKVSAAVLDDVKKRLADFAEAGDRLGAGSGVSAAARQMYDDLRIILEDPTIWGPKFAGFQRRVNGLLHQNLGVAREFDDLLVKTIGKPDPENPWMSARVVDEGKVSKALADMSEPKKLADLQRIREHLDDQKKFLKEITDLNLPATSYVKIRNAEKQIDQLRKALDQGVYLNAAQRQGQALLGYSPLGGGRAVIGAVLGGLPGAAAGAMASAALNPGKMLQFRAVTERMAESTGSRVWRGISKLLGLRIGDVARDGAGFIGKAAGRVSQKSGKVSGIVTAMLDQRGDERARTYSQTIKQLAEARTRLPELASRLDETLPTLEQALPGTRAHMLAQAQRGLDYVLARLPSQPKMRLYGETAPPLNDHDYEQFIRMAVAATDPPSILEMAEHGELTPEAVAAAEYAAPELVEFIRAEAVRAIQDHGPERVPYTNRISASLLLGTPLDESLEPEYIAIQQATHQSRTEMAAEAAKGGGGGGGETGVNKRYLQSESDRLESGEPPR